MNKTRLLTKGAMLTAIVGALILIDRQFGFFFEEIILLFLPIAIILYGVEGGLSSASLLSICIAIIGFILGNTTTYIYLPVGVVVGLSCVYVIKKTQESSSFLFCAIVIFTLCEIAVTFVIAPLLGIDLQEQIMAGSEFFNIFGQEFLSSINLGLILTYSYILSTVLVGFMEGILIWFLGIFLLRRFKVFTFAPLNLFSLNLNWWQNLLAVLFILLIPLAFVLKLEGKELYVCLTLGMLGVIGEAAFGVLWILVNKIGVKDKKISPILSMFIILFFPFTIPFFSIFGIGYNSGLLYKKTLAAVAEKQLKNPLGNKNNQKGNM